MDLKTRLARHRDDLIQSTQDSPFVVFLCGPTLNPPTRASAHLRAQLKDRLEKEHFQVILGEDEGLESEDLQQLGINAQDNELEFIRHHCNAVIVIADSVGAFCELGLFSWHFVHKKGVIKKDTTDFILLVDQQYRDDKSYLNEGPFNAVVGFGHAQFVDFDAYTGDEVIARLKSQRGVYTVDRRGRPRKART